MNSAKRGWAEKTVKNWRWWLVAPIALALIPLVGVLYLASWLGEAADWTLANTLGPLLRWSHKRATKESSHAR